MKISLIIVILFVLGSCSTKEKDVSKIVERHKSVAAPGISTPQRFKDIDTVIHLKLCDLGPFSTDPNPNTKQQLVTKVVNETLNDAFVDFYFNATCYEYDSSEGDVRKKHAPPMNCKQKDFHFIDLDLDADLDIVYSSVVDQYHHFDSNWTIILRNDGQKYKKFEISGYIYDVDFTKFQDGKVLVRSVRRPCCDYFNYNFYQTSIDTRTWQVDQVHVLEIPRKRVVEHL